MAWGRLALIEAAKLNAQTLAEVAEVFEYEKQARKVESKPEGEATAQRLSDEPLKTPTPAQRKRSSGRFVRITKIEPLEQDAEQRHDYLYDPQQQLKANDETRGTYQFDAPRPLLTSAQLIPFLHNSLGLAHPGKKIDQRVLNRLVSKGQPIQKLPFKPVQRWSQQLQILVDTGGHLRPYRSDFEQIITLLKQVLGSQNVTALRLREPMQRQQKALCIEWPTQQGKDWHHWQLPAADVPILILSDFGVMERTGNDSDLWWQIAKDLYAHPAPVISLSPVVSSPLSRAACQRLSMSPLSDAGSLPRHALKGFEHKGLSKEDLQSILILLSPLPIIDAGLLRKLRDEFKWGSSAVEAQLWNHPDMQVGSLGIRMKPSLAKDYAKRFRREVSQQDAETLWGVVEKHHQHAHQGLKQLEQIGQCVASESDNQHARSYLKQLSASTAQSAKGSAQHNALVMQCKTFLASQPDDIWNGALNDVFYDLCAMAYESEIKAGELPPMLGEHFRPERLKWLLDDKERQEYVSWSVRQLGVSGEICFEQVSTATEIASPVYRFEALKKIPPTLHMRDGTVRSVQDGLVCQADELGSVEVRTEHEVMHFDVMQKPDWAEAIGRDRYGLYADIEIAPGCLQRFRWIPAGIFMMGSPESEVDRYEDETYHQVTLTEGFWLADTTVTQSQWQAVTGKDPSKFKGENRPVETVSWDDAHGFIQTINSHLPHLEFGLPTEAQWEYACRAGTTTPFSFGKNITPDQVNYDGNRPYASAEKGELRKETVPVKSLPTNPWGLYEMHGNVWEWCQDIWQDGLRTSAVVDPASEAGQAEGGALRVLRGGAWNYDGGSVRSACRNHSAPDGRSDILGFRLFLVNPRGSAAIPEAGRQASAILNSVEQIRLSPEEVNELYKKANQAEKDGDYDLAIDTFGRIFPFIGQVMKPVILGRLGLVCKAKGDNEKALHLLKMYLLRAGSMYIDLTREAASTIATIYEELHQYEEALGYRNKALEVVRSMGDEVKLTESLKSLANTYELLGDYENAKFYYEKSLETANK
ncbi:SUMF1/EgtB/PvdO family nonheme iron enzyme [Leucothrix pacifica]|uniref:Sulfatase-modifying factor enzyme-like domain-containing protein n=1 Tax=Leucothrix pacifica TaxID=1247513 RepID=A0A317CGT6_9GAMM|nr:SUMF1/EgtB/PvdO family nonheme iron enzyme [Leucothrix pacifica]PWQ95442.1 hypothetical protein DKW60_15310 [Leucothrix pacifica]